MPPCSWPHEFPRPRELGPVNLAPGLTITAACLPQKNSQRQGCVSSLRSDVTSKSEGGTSLFFLFFSGMWQMLAKSKTNMTLKSVIILRLWQNELFCHSCFQRDF